MPKQPEKSANQRVLDCYQKAFELGTQAFEAAQAQQWDDFIQLQQDYATVLEKAQKIDAAWLGNPVDNQKKLEVLESVNSLNQQLISQAQNAKDEVSAAMKQTRNQGRVQKAYQGGAGNKF